MKLLSFLKTSIYDYATPDTKDLTVNFVGSFEATTSEKNAKFESKTVKYYTLVFDKIDHRTMKLVMECQSEHSRKDRATESAFFSCEFTKICCWTDTVIKFDETVIDSSGVKAKITGTGIYFPSSDTVRIGISIAVVDSPSDTFCLSLNAFRV